MVLTRNEESLLDPVRNIRDSIRIHIVFKLQHRRDVTAVSVRSVRRSNRPAKPRHVIEALPEPIPKRIIPRPPLFYFAAHHVHAPFFEPVERHYIGRIACRALPSPSHSIGK